MYYRRESDRVEMTVGELCMAADRHGHLDLRRPATSRSETFSGRETARRKIGETRGAGYHVDVTLHNTCRLGDVVMYVTGRADGVTYDPEGGCMVEEIRFVGGVDRCPPDPRGEAFHALTCHGYFLCCAKGLSVVTLRLTYVDHDGTEIRHTDAIRTAEQLRDAYVSLLGRCLPRAADLRQRETTLRDAAGAALFPYPQMRRAQADMVKECWRDMRRGQTVFAQAPTGIGKTMSTLYPAVRCLGEDRFDKIFYLTAKSSTRREAVGALERLRATGTPVRGCVITSREAACLCATAREDAGAGGRLSRHCRPDACPYANGYYDRVDDVIEGLLAAEGDAACPTGIFTPEVIREAARRGNVCPYELALDLSERCEVVVADYNYVFSPSVYLRRYFADGIPHTEGHRYVFLVDEAHNLPDRARDMYTAELSLSQVTAVQDVMHAWEEEQRRLADRAVFPMEDGAAVATATPEGGTSRRAELTSASLDDLIGHLSRRAGVCAESVETRADGVRRGVSLDRDAPIPLLEAAVTLGRTCDGWLWRNPSHPLYATVDALAATLRTFRTAGDYFDNGFATFTAVEGEDVRVRLTCLDPARVLGPILQKAEARVLFSATLTPTEYYADILGGGRDSATVNVTFDSPFDPANLCVAVVDGVSTRYGDRDRSYRRVATYIAAGVAAMPGNYMVYFPSYDYLERVLAAFKKKYPTVKTVVQRPGMSPAERDAFIAAFAPDAKELQIGFCVLGGLFSEGVDLPGKCLIGTIIVGVGLPGLSDERNVMRAYYDERAGGDPDASVGGAGLGYAYAYIYPGMNHVLQAAGRVIRREEDRGVVVLIDDRYTAEPYLHLYPPHWRGIRAAGDPASLCAHLRRFWNGELQDF